MQLLCYWQFILTYCFNTSYGFTFNLDILNFLNFEKILKKIYLAYFIDLSHHYYPKHFNQYLWHSVDRAIFRILFFHLCFNNLKEYSNSLKFLLFWQYSIHLTIAYYLVLIDNSFFYICSRKSRSIFLSKEEIKIIKLYQ